MSGRRRSKSWPPILDRAAELVDTLPTGVTLRQAFYLLVSGGLIDNVMSDYVKLSRLSAKARREGTFPPLIDLTRTVERLPTFSSLRDALDRLASAYRRDPLEGQAIDAGREHGRDHVCHARQRLRGAERSRGAADRRPRRRDRALGRLTGRAARPARELHLARNRRRADELDVAVIVIGSRGLTGMKKVFDASLSQQVAEHAGRPVLIVPPERCADRG